MLVGASEAQMRRNKNQSYDSTENKRVENMKVRQTDVVDRIHLSAPIHVRTRKLCTWQWQITQSHREPYNSTFSLTHHSVSAHTIRRRLQQSGLSARRPLLDLPLTQNHRRLRRQWCDERKLWEVEWNGAAFTDESRICLQHHDGRIRVWSRYFKKPVLHLRGVGAS
ncbi:transposable element Tcb1 transposase [Trichonephila clavipes]|uniref:Transposable element Tcb1 transposase n=1 Tax=Trichonephila clavipes TaxID=2585209 RepID=A0A8X6RBJ8_TRICX|nr:transposable element Tcb1 transposase [Trichonephila clavipes]